MLETIDLSLSLDRASYRREVPRREVQLRELGYQVYVQKRPVVLAFEGWDAAGKGGAIKRVTEKLDPRGYVVYPISAPQGEDKTRHYLYRCLRRLPGWGTVPHLGPVGVGAGARRARGGFRDRKRMEARL